MDGYRFDDGVVTYIDSTTSADYTYIYKSLNSNATITDGKAQWLSKRVTNASGSSSYANGIDNFLRPEKLVTIASGLTATYPV